MDKIFAGLICIFFVACTVNSAKLVHKKSDPVSIYFRISNLRPGDTLYFSKGIYDLELFANIPSGQSWDKPVVLMAADSSKPIILPNIGNRVLHFGKYNITQTPVHHIEINGFILDGMNVVSDVVKITDGAHHIRIKNCEIRNSKNQGILIAHDGSNDNEIINCGIHNNGISDFEHGIYITSDRNLVQNCEIFYSAGAGINIYDGVASANNNKVIGCHIHHNAHAGKRGAGIGIHTGDSNIAKDNIIHDNASGIHTDYGATNTLIENNILYGHSYFDLIIGDGSSDCISKNNTILIKENKTETLIGKKAIRPKVTNLLILNSKSEIDIEINKIQNKSNE